MERSPSLLERAAEALARDPVPTLELARRVMGMRGNPEAAARAVFTLLGSDPRFRVDVDGVWTLAEDADPVGRPLAGLRFAVVDVETTGGAPTRGDRITEVAVVHVNDGIVGESFESLVDPGRPIPPRIQGITGITDAMVRTAPPFEAIADRVRDRIRDRVFVAHNAAFDWRFVHAELLEATGDSPRVERLCTVRLGRLLEPRLRSHGLDSLAGHFGVPIADRHRALGDALATARILVHLLREADARGIRDLGSLRRHLET